MTRKEMIKRLNEGEDLLDLSIEKWQDIVMGKGRDEGPDNCALCYFHRELNPPQDKDKYFSCDRCVIFQDTCKVSCHGTPYARYAMRPYERTDEAEEMLAYLIGLKEKIVKERMGHEEWRLTDYERELLKEIIRKILGDYQDKEEKAVIARAIWLVIDIVDEIGIVQKEIDKLLVKREELKRRLNQMWKEIRYEQVIKKGETQERNDNRGVFGSIKKGK